MRHSRFGQNRVPSMKKDRFRTLHEIVKAARLNLNQTDWDYLIGGTETETTLKRNRHAIDGRALRPFVLNDVSSIDCTTEFFGATLAMPVMLAPIGSLQVFDAGVVPVLRSQLKTPGLPAWQVLSAHQALKISPQQQTTLNFTNCMFVVMTHGSTRCWLASLPAVIWGCA